MRVHNTSSIWFFMPNPLIGLPHILENKYPWQFFGFPWHKSNKQHFFLERPPNSSYSHPFHTCFCSNRQNKGELCMLYLQFCYTFRPYIFYTKFPDCQTFTNFQKIPWHLPIFKKFPDTCMHGNPAVGENSQSGSSSRFGLIYNPKLDKILPPTFCVDPVIIG